VRGRHRKPWLKSFKWAEPELKPSPPRGKKKVEGVLGKVFRRRGESQKKNSGGRGKNEGNSQNEMEEGKWRGVP